jgi:hypothetical protein
MKAGGIVIIIVASLMFAGSAFFGIFSVKNSGAADRIELMVAKRGSRAFGAMLGDRIRRKASRQGTYALVLGIVGLLGLVGGIVMIKIGGKRKKAAQEAGTQDGAGAQPGGPAVAAQPAATPPAPAAVAPVPAGPLPPDNWYVGVGGQQEGPLTLADLQQRIASGALDRSAHVFHQQLGPWMPITSVPQLAQALG